MIITLPNYINCSLHTMSKSKSIVKTKRLGTQEFFPRSKPQPSSSGTSFTFNKAPINKTEAYKETRTKVIADNEEQEDNHRHGRKQKTFLNKLYQDDDEFDELKVHGLLDENDEEVTEARNEQAQMVKRKAKAIEKMGQKSSKKVVDKSTRIGKLSLKKDTLGMFAICEVGTDYLIVNHTRNTKGYVPLTATEVRQQNFKKGMLVVAMVSAEIGGATSGDIYNFKSGKAGLNRKVQLTMDHKYINKLLSIDTVKKFMTLQGEIESREEKGFLVNFGFRDHSKGFLKFDDNNKKCQKGQRVSVLVKSCITSSKVIQCELMTEKNSQECVQQSNTDLNLEDEHKLTLSQLKPGFLVSAKVSNLFENGLELNFLGGMTGTCFVDHLDQKTKELKIGEKVSARIISVDHLNKKVTLSTLLHIVNWSKDTKSLKALSKVGDTFETAKVAKHLYGNSYMLDLGGDKTGFLHKLHSSNQVQEEVVEQDEMEMPVRREAQETYNVGHSFQSVKVKEINYFDMVPMLSVKDQILDESSLNYHMVKVGDYLDGTIEKINNEHKFVSLRVSEFVQGNLHIEHMADHPIKQMPPKLLEVGKKVRVRVFHVDTSKRYIEFTKKDSFMKDDAPVYSSYREVKKGDKLICNVVSRVEHGLVIKSFGNIKGLITFEDIMQKEKVTSVEEKNYKPGTVLNAYVLFKKADKGIALTLSKKKANVEGNESAKTGPNEALQESFLPNDKQLEAIITDSKLTTLVKQGQDSSLVGQTFTFRTLASAEEDIKLEPYLLIKSLDASKKSKNFLAVLPMCLVSNFSCFSNLNLKGQTFTGVVLEIFQDSLPVVSIQPELIALKKEIPCNPKGTELKLSSGQTYIGVCNGLQGKAGHVSVRFFNGVSRSIKVKDLNTTSEYAKIYTPGKVLRVAVNKLERLCTKQQVVTAALSARSGSEPNSDIQVITTSLATQYLLSQQNHPQIGKVVEAEVQLVKDYGIIMQILTEGHEVKTGFILNDHKLQSKYKTGMKLKCRVLDVDFDKKIADLKEISDKQTEEGSKTFKPDQKVKVIVEINKEGYLVVSLKSQRQTLGLCFYQNFNQDAEKPEFEVGQEIEAIVRAQNEKNGFYELFLAPKEAEKTRTAGGSTPTIELKAGIKFSGQIRSIKGQNIYVQLPKSQASPKQVVIGRLHMIECQTIAEFRAFAVGDRIECKILNVMQEKERTWIELTRSQKHLSKLQGLDQELVSQTPMSADDLKVGQSYSVMVVSSSIEKDVPINLKFSQPIQLQVSPFVRGLVPFDCIQETNDLAKFGSVSIKIKTGQRLTAYYIGNSNFSMVEGTVKSSFKKGDLVTTRFVQYIPGKGITVQLTSQKAQHQYGFLPLCELTDEINANVVQQTSEKGVFAARVIDFEAKTGKPILSSRESVLGSAGWKLIGARGTSLAFKEADEKIQLDGNMRNKILKYGADLSLQRGDLALGYVVNIGKAGCFIQIGQNCTVRAGLNELSDNSNFDFASEMPVGRLVVGRISKTDEPKDSTGTKRFHFSTRQSIVVYGVGTVDRSKLTVEDEVEAIVMAIADGKAFAQIKGSYLKLKVKEGPKNLKVGDQIVASLKKVTKEKLSSVFLRKLEGSEQITEEQRVIQGIYQSVEKEAASSLSQVKAFLAECQGKQAQQSDFDAAHIDQKNFLGRDEQIAQQIADLEDLEKKSEEDEDMEANSQDSDAEEIKRLMNIKYESDKEVEEGEEDSEDAKEAGSSDADMDDEEGEEEYESSEDDQQPADDLSEGSDLKRASKKRTLKDRLKEEQEIRNKEKKMRSGDYQPKDIDDFERLLVANQDQSYLWIQYVAFMLDNLGVDAARKVAERAVKAVSMTNEEDKLNIWTAFMNLESNFGSQDTLEKCTKRALDVNERKRVYVNLIDIYKASQNLEYIEPIYKQLVKKFSSNVDLWGSYLEFLMDMRTKKADKHVVASTLDFSDPKTILQKSLQALSKEQHVAMISKFGMLEFKSGNPESGRTMFEGIVGNYPKRMDIWAVYMDMESKHGKGNNTQARHLFERCLSNDHILKKPKKMKLVFQKYMEYEKSQGNKSNLADLRKRVEDYLSKVYDEPKENEDQDTE